MKIHRFIGPFDLKKTSLTIIDQEIIGQISRVLRLAEGKQILLSDGNCNEALGEIANINKQNIEVKIRERFQNTSESSVNVILYCSILKRENFELVVQKATEVGVTKIIPLVTSRTVKFNLKKERLEKIIKEAAEQSGRGVVPELGKSQTFEEAIKNASQNALNIFFDSSGVKHHAENYMLQSIGVWIGPEGGWSEKELEEAKNHNFPIASLGKLTLRAETAAIIAPYLIIHG